MKSKQFVVDSLEVIVVKRPSSRNIRLTIAPSGEIRVSLPTYLPYQVGLTFVIKKSQWIKKHLPDKRLFVSGQAIGKSHHLYFQPSPDDQLKSKIKNTEALVFIPNSLRSSSKEVQLEAKKVVEKALRIQAENLLPLRLKDLATKHGFSFSEVRFRKLKNRWGSCDRNKKITLNIYLMELPWELIDYVIIHELNHTKHLNHGPDFWQSLEELIPNLKELKKEIKKYRNG